ncbi:MAG: helix-turn-helix transcriptional regulator [Pseudomonadota bacterium]
MFLSEWRQHRGLTQKALAVLSGTSHATISALESGDRDFKGAWLDTFSKVFDCHPVDLLGPPGTPVRAPAEPVFTIGEIRGLIETCESKFREKGYDFTPSARARVYTAILQAHAEGEDLGPGVIIGAASAVDI